MNEKVNKKSYGSAFDSYFLPLSHTPVKTSKSNKQLIPNQEHKTSYTASNTNQINHQSWLLYGDLAKWLFDSGTKSHFNPIFEDLIEPQKLQKPLHIHVADDSTLRDYWKYGS